MYDKMMKKGFTLIELSLSIAFIAILSITIVLIITNTVASYHRGLTLSQINTVGMDLVDELRATIQNSPSRPVTDECETNYTESDLSTSAYQKCLKDGAKKFVVDIRYANVDMRGKGNKMAPVWGTFCTGTYSFIWNSGYFFNSEYKVNNGSAVMASLKYKTGSEMNSTATVSGFKLLKVQDDTRAVCAAMAGVNEDATKSVYADVQLTNNVIELKTLMDEAPEDILAGSEDAGRERNNLAVYDLSAAEPATGGMANDLFYAVSLILGTVQGGADVTAKGNFCATPNDYSENFDYCAINKFNFAVQATGG